MCNFTSRRWCRCWPFRGGVRLSVSGLSILLCFSDQHACGNKLQLFHQNTPTHFITHAGERRQKFGVNVRSDTESSRRHGSGEFTGKRSWFNSFLPSEPEPAATGGSFQSATRLHRKICRLKVSVFTARFNRLMKSASV